MYAFFNTKQDDPIVVDLPPGNTTASFFGTFEDAWWVPLVDVGGGGKGGKYVILPPDYKDGSADWLHSDASEDV